MTNFSSTFSLTSHVPTRTAKEQFDRQATHYNQQWSAWSEESLVWLLSHADCRPDDTALDVATGTGYTALGFAPYVRAIVGLDVSSGMLKEAQQKAQAQGITNVSWVEGAAEAIPFPDATFTLVTCRIAPHHFLSVSRFVSEVTRVLKPGGRFLLADTSVPDNDPEAAAWQNHVETLRDPSHVCNYTMQEWHTLLEANGLGIEEIGNEGGHISITLNDWMTKAGCTPEQAVQVRAAFDTAPQAAVRAFQIVPQDNDDIAFCWQRVVIRAVKP